MRISDCSSDVCSSDLIAGRLTSVPGAEAVFRRGAVSRDVGELCAAAGLGTAEGAHGVSTAAAATIARALRDASRASHALAVLVALDDGVDRTELGGTICIGVADGTGAATRGARLLGGPDWVRMGAAELVLDALRRHLLGLPVDERIDFEKR